MSGTAEQIKSIILKCKGRTRKQQIARELKLGLEYVGLICRELERKGEIAFRKGVYSLITADHKPPKPSKLPKRRPRVSRRPLRPRSKVSQLRQLAPTRKRGERSVFSAIPKMNRELMKVLKKAGYKTIESLADAPIARFMQETKLKLHEAARLINQARKMLNKIGE